MFTFSRLQGRYELKGDRIVFYPPVTLTISSPFDRFIQELANTMLQKGDLELVGCKVYVANIKVLPEVQIGDEIRINMLSPVVVYSTLETKEKIIKYCGTIIKGWMGRFVLNGNKKLLKLGYDCGIGAKNSQGFGMVAVLNDGRG